MMTAPAQPLEIKSLLRGKTVISADAVEVTRNGLTQRFQKSMIKGFRSARARYVTIFTLEILNEPKPVKFNVPHRQEASVRAFLSGVRDLDAADLQAAETAIRKDEGFGASPDERWQTLKAEKRLTLILNLVCGGIAGWGLIYPHPYNWSVLACVGGTLATLVLTFLKRGRWYLIPRKNDPHPSLMIGMLLLAAAVWLRALIDVSLLEWARVLAISCAVGIALAALVLMLFSEMKLSRWPAAFVGAAFAFGVIAQTDARLDTAVPETFEPKVVSMYVSHGRATSYHVTLSSWGPQTGDNSHDVPSDLYNQLSIEGAACVALYPGALHLRWYTISVCGGRK